MIAMVFQRRILQPGKEIFESELKKSRLDDWTRPLQWLEWIFFCLRLSSKGSELQGLLVFFMRKKKAKGPFSRKPLQWRHWREAPFNMDESYFSGLNYFFLGMFDWMKKILVILSILVYLFILNLCWKKCTRIIGHA